MELGYMNGVLYDSVVSVITNKVPEHIPQTQQPQVLTDITNTIVYLVYRLSTRTCIIIA